MPGWEKTSRELFIDAIIERQERYFTDCNNSFFNPASARSFAKIITDPDFLSGVTWKAAKNNPTLPWTATFVHPSVTYQFGPAHEVMWWGVSRLLDVFSEWVSNAEEKRIVVVVPLVLTPNGSHVAFWGTIS